MSKTIWRPVGLVDHGRLREARFEAHYAVQWLARAARAIVPPQPDDSHSNFGWDDAFGGFMTRALKGDLCLGLKVIDPNRQSETEAFLSDAVEASFKALS